GRDVNGHDPPHVRSGRHGEAPGPGAQVDHRAGPADPMSAEHGEVSGQVRESLLAVEPGDEAGIEMLTPGVGKLIDQPRLGHVLDPRTVGVALAGTRIGWAGRSAGCRAPGRAGCARFPSDGRLALWRPVWCIW